MRKILILIIGTSLVLSAGAVLAQDNFLANNDGLQDDFNENLADLGAVPHYYGKHVAAAEAIIKSATI